MVDPKIEILGVLEYYSDPMIPKYLSENSQSPIEKEYHFKIDHYFSLFQEHPALRKFREMKESGFKSEQAVRLLLYHSQIPYLFSQPVIQNQKYLEWIQLLRLWIDETKFPSFFEKNKSLYQLLIESAEKSLNQIPLCDVVEIFFGEKKPSYQIYLSSLKIGNFNVFLPTKSIAVILGSPQLSATDIYPRIIHEIAHCFIRPAIDLHWSAFQSFKESNEVPIKREAVYELIVQAVQAVLAPDSIPVFSLLSTLINKIKEEFQTRRDLYPMFSTFVPKLAVTMKEN
jgi:hypothetical protein